MVQCVLESKKYGNLFRYRNGNYVHCKNCLNPSMCTFYVIWFCSTFQQEVSISESLESRVGQGICFGKRYNGIHHESRDMKHTCVLGLPFFATF